MATATERPVYERNRVHGLQFSDEQPRRYLLPWPEDDLRPLALILAATHNERQRQNFTRDD